MNDIACCVDVDNNQVSSTQLVRGTLLLSFEAKS
jgi:hypothetical protein